MRGTDWSKRMIFIIIAAVAAVVFFQGRGERRGVSGIGEPVQKEASGGTRITIDDYDMDIIYRYSYDIEALVVHTEDYFPFDIGDKLAPRDLALAWGDVAAYNDRVDFHWKQSGRWYFWQADYDGISRVGGFEMVGRQSSNNHIIPCDENIKKLIKAIKMGDHIRLKGYLVDITGCNQEGVTFSWSTSTSRSDGGAHSCEVIYVTGVEWL